MINQINKDIENGIIIMNNRERFVDELYGEYDKQFEVKEWIEGKPDNLLTICGITIPLLFGFSSFFHRKNW